MLTLFFLSYPSLFQITSRLNQRVRLATHFHKVGFSILKQFSCNIEIKVSFLKNILISLLYLITELVDQFSFTFRLNTIFFLHILKSFFPREYYKKKTCGLIESKRHLHFIINYVLFFLPLKINKSYRSVSAVVNCLDVVDREKS